ncbi:MAG: hypothetical protein QM726_16060 [Chitinophagaceae bacterium]
MKKRYLIAVLTLIVMAFTFSGCYVERYPRYYHHPHPYYHHW